jgi:hypothetical protein
MSIGVTVIDKEINATTVIIKPLAYLLCNLTKKPVTSLQRVYYLSSIILKSNHSASVQP